MPRLVAPIGKEAALFNIKSFKMQQDEKLGESLNLSDVPVHELVLEIRNRRQAMEQGAFVQMLQEVSDTPLAEPSPYLQYEFNDVCLLAQEAQVSILQMHSYIAVRGAQDDADEVDGNLQTAQYMLDFIKNHEGELHDAVTQKLLNIVALLVENARTFDC